jgi:hypothetical protein
MGFILKGRTFVPGYVEIAFQPHQSQPEKLVPDD